MFDFLSFLTTGYLFFGKKILTTKIAVTANKTVTHQAKFWERIYGPWHSIS